MASETAEYVSRMTELVENVQYRLCLAELLRKTDLDRTGRLRRQDLNSMGSCWKKADRLFRFKLQEISAHDVPW